MNNDTEQSSEIPIEDEWGFADNSPDEDDILDFDYIENIKEQKKAEVKSTQIGRAHV